MLIPLGILAVAGAGASGGAYELIESSILTSNTTSVTFSSIPQTYKHLEIRYVSRSTGSRNNVDLRLNGLTTGYRTHFLFGDGFVGSETNTSDFINGPMGVADNNSADSYGAGVISVLDYALTSKNKTVRALTGARASARQRVNLVSGSTFTTDALTSIELFTNGANLMSGSRFSLYGIKE